MIVCNIVQYSTIITSTSRALSSIFLSSLRSGAAIESAAVYCTESTYTATSRDWRACLRNTRFSSCAHLMQASHNSTWGEIQTGDFGIKDIHSCTQVLRQHSLQNVWGIRWPLKVVTLKHFFHELITELSKAPHVLWSCEHPDRGPLAL